MDYTPRASEVLTYLAKRGCVTCPDSIPNCPACAPDHSCVQVSRTCNSCASRQCVLTADAAAAPPPSPSSHTNVGAIVGGVIGGVVAIALATWLIWRFCIKPRRAQYEEEYPEEYADDKESWDNRPRGPSQIGHRSHPSVRSMASTVMTRASNVIQIAFIPGITDRSGSDCPNSAVPPVPPVPLELADTQPATPYSARQIPPSPYTDTNSTDHYFMPQDLRQSRFSEFTDDSDVRSTRHYSIASSLARASFASAVYGQSTVSPVQTAMPVGKANVVSVSSSQRATPGGTIPEMPSIDYLKYGHQQYAANQLSHLSKTSRNSSATTISTKEVVASPTDIRYGGQQVLRSPQVAITAKSSATLLNGDTPPSNLGGMTTIQAGTNAHDSTVPALPSNFASTSSAAAAGPSNAAATTTEKKTRQNSQHLTAAIAEATKRASKQPTHGGLGSVPVQRVEQQQQQQQRDPSPFSDENEVRH